jgi:hypothetical protein
MKIIEGSDQQEMFEDNLEIEELAMTVEEDIVQLRKSYEELLELIKIGGDLAHSAQLVVDGIPDYVPSIDKLKQSVIDWDNAISNILKN